MRIIFQIRVEAQPALGSAMSNTSVKEDFTAINDTIFAGGLKTGSDDYFKVREICCKYINGHDETSRIKEENRQLRSVLAKLVYISDRKHDVWDNAKALLAKCPECGSGDYIQFDNEGDGVAPESTYFLCNDCGHASDPE